MLSEGNVYRDVLNCPSISSTRPFDRIIFPFLVSQTVSLKTSLRGRLHNASDLLKDLRASALRANPLELTMAEIHVYFILDDTRSDRYSAGAEHRSAKCGPPHGC